MVHRRDLLKSGLALPLVPAALTTGARPTAAAQGPEGWERGAQPRYRLNIAKQQVAPFGKETTALLANVTWPGTEMRFTKGEDFRVLVENAMDEPTTLHWHGMIVPNLEDGVPEVTQAPIVPGAALYYAYRLQQSGTYWYHSHVGLQLQQGLSGPLIIEDPDEPQGYDEDVTVFLSDFISQSPDSVVKGLKRDQVDVSVEAPYAQPDGAKFPTDVPYDGFLINGQAPDQPWTKAVKPGATLRLRLINGSGSTYFRVGLDGLAMTVIAADGEPLAPIEVDNLVIATAQRYDVLVTLPGSGSHTLHAAALGLDRQGLAVIHSRDVEAKPNSARPAFEGRALDPGALRAPRETTLPDGPQKTFEVVLSGNMERYLWQMNGVSWPEAFANFKGITPKESYYGVSFGDRVRFDMVNRTPMAHPMHLHGHFFRVLADGMDPATHPMRDTVSVPPRGKVSIEFYANNPGQWFYHCHNVWHLAVGMAEGVRYMV